MSTVSRTWLPGLALLAISALAAGPVQSADPTLYALLVFDTHAETIGEQTLHDRDNLTRVLYKAFDQDGHRHRLEVVVLDGDEATPERIFQYYDELQSTDADTSLFYYTGHGGTDTTLGHYLAMAHGNVFRSDLRGAMQSCPSRRDIIITDCCANYVDTSPVAPALAGADADWDVAKDLFFQGSGLVDVNAASPGGVSWSNPLVGGYYTAAFSYQICRPRAELDTDGSGAVTWSEFLKHVDAHILAEYVSKEDQRSYTFYIDQSPQHFWERALRVANNTSEPINVHLELYTKINDDEWAWVTPAQQLSLAPGESTPLPSETDGGLKLEGQSVRIWAESADGQRTWLTHKEEDFDLADPRFGYTGDQPEVKTYSFDE